MALWDVLGSPQGGKIRETVRWETQCRGGPASRVPTPKMAKGRGAVGAPAAASSLPRMRFVSRGTCPCPAGLCWRRRAA